MLMNLNPGRSGSSVRKGELYKVLALLMPALIVTVAICIDLGFFAFAINRDVRDSGIIAKSKTLLFEPFVFTAVIAVFTWFLIIVRPPRS